MPLKQGSNQPCQLERTLKKIRHTPPQSQTGGAEKRKANIAGAYAAGAALFPV